MYQAVNQSLLDLLKSITLVYIERNKFDKDRQHLPLNEPNIIKINRTYDINLNIFRNVNIDEPQSEKRIFISSSMLSRCSHARAISAHTRVRAWRHVIALENTAKNRARDMRVCVYMCLLLSLYELLELPCCAMRVCQQQQRVRSAL